ncbi:unnamed protein product, partial [Rotaria sordida]
NGPPRDRTNQTIVFEHIYLSVFISITICSGIGLIISISLFVFNIHFRKHRYIRMSSPVLNNIILGGCMLAYISMILLGIDSSLFPQTIFTETIMNIICATRVWFLCISFTLAFGSMFSKTWRVHSIFTNINLTKKGIHDSRLLVVVVFVPKIVEVYHDPYSKKKQLRLTTRLYHNTSRKTLLTIKNLNDAIIDNQQLRFVLSLQEQTLDRLIKEIDDYSMEKHQIEEPFELERLLVPDNEIEDETEEVPTIVDDVEEEEEEEEDNDYRIIPHNNRDLKGRVARAVSLCLYNKIHTAQLYWPERVCTTRYSLSQLEHYQHSPSIKLFRTSSQKSTGFTQIEESHEQTSNLLTTSSTRDLESVYDGLIGLDEIRLNKMIETDLISSYY